MEKSPQGGGTTLWSNDHRVPSVRLKNRRTASIYRGVEKTDRKEQIIRELKYDRCPRCGGRLFWPYIGGSPAEKELFKDKVKCFSCSRMFYPAKINGRYIWKQWPERNEEIDIVYLDQEE